MDALTMLWVICAVALALTIARYFLDRPSGILLCFIQNGVGVLFIFSGFVKAVDPLGFSYKLDEYFEVFADATKQTVWLSALMLWFKNLTLFLATFMTVLEMALGWMLIFGIRMKLTSRLMLLLIIFFTFLTGYSWYTGKITDCGCFGDAIHLSNAETFYKDVVLLVLIVLLVIFHKRIKAVFLPTASNMVMAVGVAASVYLPVYCLRHLPLIDFRPYKIGNNIREQMQLAPGEQPDQYVTILRYKDKNSGAIGNYMMTNGDEDHQSWFQTFNLQPLPWQDSVWMEGHEFVESKSELVQEGSKPKITDFRVWDNDNNDLTAAVLDTPGYHFWVVAYDMKCANHPSFSELNALAGACDKNSIPFVALTATPYEELDSIRHELNAAFPFYYVDGTVLKTVIRANPGLMLLNGPVVVAKWHYNDLPTFDAVKAKYFH